MNILKVNGITKILKTTPVLQNVNLYLQSGMVCGLIGKNGSGKTMLIRSIAGLMKPTEGSIFWNDKELYHDIDFIPRLGVIIENVGLYPELSAFQNLKFLAKINKIVSDEDICTAISRVGLDPHDKRILKKYSLGMRQKVAIAQAIMEKPDILVLDEPTNALDETSTKNVRNILRQESERGAIVIIASHNKEDIEGICNPIYKMADGFLTLMEESS